MAKTIHTPETRWVIRSKAKNEEGDYVFVNEDFFSDDDWLPTLFMSKQDAQIECDPDEEPVMVKVVLYGMNDWNAFRNHLVCGSVPKYTV